ncbi:hypothetical protein EBZ70_06685, partial [bacterium]|nr:hypothetical protein [bacterium]
MKRTASSGLALSVLMAASLAVLGVRGCVGVGRMPSAAAATNVGKVVPPKAAGAEAPLSGELDAADRETFAALLRKKFNRADVRPDEAVLTFKDEAARRAFLARAAA